MRIVANWLRSYTTQHRIPEMRWSTFITISQDEDKNPREVFVSCGRDGEIMNDLTGALGIIMSIALQYGVPKEAFIKALKDYPTKTIPRFLHNRLVNPSGAGEDIIVSPPVAKISGARIRPSWVDPDYYHNDGTPVPH